MNDGPPILHAHGIARDKADVRVHAGPQLLNVLGDTFPRAERPGTAQEPSPVCLLATVRGMR